jgi:hypothetical protein
MSPIDVTLKYEINEICLNPLTDTHQCSITGLFYQPEKVHLSDSFIHSYYNSHVESIEVVD